MRCPKSTNRGKVFCTGFDEGEKTIETATNLSMSYCEQYGDRSGKVIPMMNIMLSVSSTSSLFITPTTVSLKESEL